MTNWGCAVCSEPIERFSALCLVCGDLVPTWSPRDTVKICEKCKAAIMKVRAEMESEND